MEKITVKVAYATLKLQKVIQLNIKSNSSVMDAIIESKIFNYFDELSSLNHNQLSLLPIGIYGKKIEPSTYQLKDNDRIEIYRKLDQSPNQKRLKRQTDYQKN